MPNYKDQNNQIHFLDDATYAHLLPQGCVEITEAEAEVIRQASIPVPVIPQVVSMRKARLALHQFGILDAIEASMATASKSDQIEWEYATEVVRTSPLVVNMVASLGLTEQQVDDLFALADTL